MQQKNNNNNRNINFFFIVVGSPTCLVLTPQKINLFENLNYRRRKKPKMEQEIFSFTNSDLVMSSKNAAEAFWNDTKLRDVILVTSDDEQINAHKIILCTFSSFFRNVLIKNPHPSPLIYLKDVKHSVLVSILKFIYLGSCEIANDKLEKIFLLQLNTSRFYGSTMKTSIILNSLEMTLPILSIKDMMTRKEI